MLSRGTELCDVVEVMYSLEWSFRQLGAQTPAHLALLDKVERLAFNAFPGTCTADMWQHQYDHQTNAIAAEPGVLCGGSNGGGATIFGLQPNYPCCTVNMPQAWPKLAMAAVLQAHDESHVLVNHLLPVNVSLGLGTVVIK